MEDVTECMQSLNTGLVYGEVSVNMSSIIVIWEKTT